MSCTIDHLRPDHRAEIIQEFTDARGVTHRAGEHGILRRIDLDWPSQEIQIEWECEGGRKMLVFGVAAKEGPRNGAMREFFAVGEYSPVSRTKPITPSPALNCAPTLSVDVGAKFFGEASAKQPSTEICLGEKSVACKCDSHLHRAVLVEPRNIHVTACLRCGTVTCTRMFGDDGRYHGNSWYAYWTVQVRQSIVDWLALWPRVKVTYGESRWPMSSLLVRRDYLYYPADIRCQDSEQLTQLKDD
jgi:hypothetical protein